jgi:hypothetical protein
MRRSRVACLIFSAYILTQKQGTRAEKTAVTVISRKLLCAGHCGPQRRIRRKSLRQRTTARTPHETGGTGVRPSSCWVLAIEIGWLPLC